jgi:DNA-binding XRE family transcriptional regulator
MRVIYNTTLISYNQSMETLEQFIDRHQANKEKSSSFVDYLYVLMDKYNFNNPADIYKKANISRQLWSSIISEKSHPSLNVCLKIALVMHITNRECKYLLKKAGYTLASSNKFALIIRYAIENKIYDINEVNGLLENNGYGDSLII